ncbi:MAG TPA: adenosylcobinamide-GDP ribazoletransferase [Actinomycetota bacterium]
MSPGRGLRGALAFLTRAPVDRGHGAREVAGSVPWFPVAGALVGLLVAGVYAAGVSVLPSLPAAVVAVAAGVLATGALHEDGLADLADALGARGPDDARRIMKDPTHGTFGVLALTLSVAARAAAIASLGPWAALAWVPAAHAASRGASVGLLARARAGPRLEGLGPEEAHRGETGGLGVGTAAHLSEWEGSAALSIGLAVSALGVGFWAVPVGALVLAATAGLGWLAARRLGGVTGDVIGAAQQVGEVLVLLLGAAAVTQGWPGAVWWR